ncbi:hypothetical protein [Larkinella terrae]|uniref:DUF3592 domain-containing protein n=1 Tax=Larkinella terrae TaxID=2025311 RepID=A0A7K0ETE5_9BACT|nr:hypothetical protein [Larkinella terrae]MRS64688.1 hypothetical protein [Larkinella terrae]
MLREVFVFLGKLYRFFISLVLIALLSGFAWVLWHFYEDERVQSQFLREGKVVEVRVADIDVSRRSWRDIFGNVTYVTVPYRQKSYNVRVVRDTAWVSSGDRIKLLYHPQRDEFRQQAYERKPGRMVSRFIHWSSVSGFSKENKILVSFLVVITCLFFLVGGFLVNLTGWTFLQTVARLMLVIVLGIAALFFTYDTWVYLQYYQHVKKNGQPMDVTVLETDRNRVGRGTNNTGFELYVYDATFKYRNDTRVAPITEDEYDALKPKDQLRVLYDSKLDDFMSATYSGDYSRAIIPVFFWFLFLVLFWNSVLKPGKKPNSM